MTTFDDRANAFENKFAHDADMQFRAEARRNKLLGLWAADMIGKTGDEAAAYAREVVAAQFEAAGSEGVIKKVVTDLVGRATADEVRGKQGLLLAEAKAQLLTEI